MALPWIVTPASLPCGWEGGDRLGKGAVNTSGVMLDGQLQLRNVPGAMVVGWRWRGWKMVPHGPIVEAEDLCA